MGPTALPIRDEGVPYTARHGQGTVDSSTPHTGIALDLLQYVPLDDRSRSLGCDRNTSVRSAASVTAYVRVGAAAPGASALSVVTEPRSETGAIACAQPWNMTFGSVSQPRDLDRIIEAARIGEMSAIYRVRCARIDCSLAVPGGIRHGLVTDRQRRRYPIARRTPRRADRGPRPADRDRSFDQGVSWFSRLLIDQV